MKTLSIICAVLFFLPRLALSTPIPDTGQTKCYDDLGNEINPCPQPSEPFYGQDAQYDVNPQSYTKLNSNGNDLPDDAPWPWAMVRDNVTGLIWEVKTEDGSIHDRDNIYTWERAMAFSSTLNTEQFGGYNDWRLPTVKEQHSIVDSSIPYPGPAINTSYFSHTQPPGYWSSTTFASEPIYAWFVFFYDGSLDVGYKYNHNHVRAVRSGQCGSFRNFIDHGDGTMTDTGTGLMWQKDTASVTYTWQQALSYCENLQLAEFDDWRLPNINEIQSLVDNTRYNPSIDPVFFNTVSSYYWSSTTCASEPIYAWFVDFRNGWVAYGHDKFRSFYVRAVRGGHCESFGDLDGDCRTDCIDNCPDAYNPEQEDIDFDTIGDACDNCPTIHNSNQNDSDEDSIGNVCDNCPNVYNPTQEDTDDDGIGNACDNCPHDANNDMDADTICYNIDNCPNTSNSDQLDTYPPEGNSIGDACDCEPDFICDGDVDGSDASTFKLYFGRNPLYYPCNFINPCNGNFNCDQDVDGTDAALFKQDFGRSPFQNPCPACVAGVEWCGY